MPQAAPLRGSRPGKRANYSHATHRLREIERIISDRHGVVPDTDDAETYVLPAALCFRQLAIDHGRLPTAEHVGERLAFWCERWAPAFRLEIPALVAGISKTRKPGIGQADKIAAALRLSDVDRTRLGIKTIGAFDVNKKAREKRRRDKKRDRDRVRAAAKRAAKGSQTRAEWLAKNDQTRKQPWNELGISRATFMRRRAKAKLVTAEAEII